MMNKFLNKKGFTLIELLVVIAIIGLLASIVLASLNAARIKGRDARRISDIEQINNAIQLYIHDFGHAPYLGAANCSASNLNASCGASSNNSSWDLLKTDLQNYIKLPVDPVNSPYDPGEPSLFDGQLFYHYSAPGQFSEGCDYPSHPIDSSYCQPYYGKDDVYGLYAAYESKSTPGYAPTGGAYPAQSVANVIYSASTPRNLVIGIGSHL